MFFLNLVPYISLAVDNVGGLTAGAYSVTRAALVIGLNSFAKLCRGDSRSVH
jgi:hypothetical protein